MGRRFSSIVLALSRPASELMSRFHTALLALAVALALSQPMERAAPNVSNERRRLQSMLFGSQPLAPKAPEPCVKFGSQFDVPLQGTNVVLDCPSTYGAPNKKVRPRLQPTAPSPPPPQATLTLPPPSPLSAQVCCAAHFPTLDHARRNGSFFLSHASSSAAGRGRTEGPVGPSGGSRGVGWAYAESAGDGASASQPVALRPRDSSITRRRLLEARAPGRRSRRLVCTLSKTYYSSPQELRDLAVARRIAQAGTASLSSPAPLDAGTKLPADVHNARLDLLLAYATSDEIVRNSTLWLRRVRLHMSSPLPPARS